MLVLGTLNKTTLKTSLTYALMGSRPGYPNYLYSYGEFKKFDVYNHIREMGHFALKAKFMQQ